MWMKKEKMLLTSILSFSLSVFKNFYDQFSYNMDFTMNDKMSLLIIFMLNRDYLLKKNKKKGHFPHIERNLIRQLQSLFLPSIM